ncbi:MAG: prolyl oligopeptidase family serine peptidase [Planctomycetes bacterium]|nr:prolyl oligopeptidase family serine peptidase [Planctomycetota bacterium]
MARKLPNGKTVRLRYLLYLPPGYDKAPKKRWPLMLFLHGAGERGSDLRLLLRHGPPKLIERGKDFPFIVVSPQCPRGRWWDVDALAALLAEAVGNYRVDTGRIYVTGLSMGGFGTWALAARLPKLLAAIVPICGGGDPRWAERIKDIPTWVFHGAKDPIVPVARARQMVDALKRAGAKEVHLTIYPEARHDSWTKTYDDPRLYAWLLKHRRQPPASRPARRDERPRR